MDYNYQYNLGLRLVNKDTKHALHDEHFKTTIQKAESEYNKICSGKQINPKMIVIHKINRNSIILTLYSTLALNTPGKALRTFSQILLKENLFAETFVFGKQLFTTFDVTTDTSQDDEFSSISAEDISDALFLNSLVSHFLNKRDADSKTYAKKRKAIDKMKILAYECGIVKLDE